MFNVLLSTCHAIYKCSPSYASVCSHTEWASCGSNLTAGIGMIREKKNHHTFSKLKWRTLNQPRPE